jgi:RNA polymerase sigma-70 factor (ECF subfamily)
MSSEADRIAVLLDRLVRGDDEALGALFETYRPHLRMELSQDLAADPRLAARFDASDVVQEVFLDARQQVHWFQANAGHVDFWVWLRGLARERRLKFVRDHLDAQCRTAKRQRALPDESWQHPQAPDASPSAAAQAAEQAAALRDALGRLRPEDQEIIRLRITEGRTNPEVAALLQLTPGAVAKRLERALQRLRPAAQPAMAGDSSAEAESWSKHPK